MKKTAVVTGANRGIGLGMSEALAKKGYRVVMVCRDGGKCAPAAASLESAGLDVVPMTADVADSEQVARLGREIAARFEHIDVLINAAGVIGNNPNEAPNDIEHADFGSILETLNINAVGALRMIQALLPLLKKSAAARVVNISSGMGAVSEMEGGYPGYRMSKAAMNAVTKVAAAELQGTFVKVNSVCPGWVRTDMGGPNADRSVEEAIPGIVWAAELGEDGESGGFFRDGRRLQY